MYLLNNTSFHNMSFNSMSFNNMSDYYSILNVSHTASMNEIKSSFRKLSLKFHPDKDKSESSAAHYNNIMTAYGVLEDEASRKKYDNSNNNSSSNNNNSSSSHNSNLSDCQSLVRIDSSGEDVLRPSTISCILTITLEQSFTGCQCPIEIDRCIHENEYMVREKEKIYVDIASGIDNGEIIILKNRGNETVKGLVGDVKVHIQVRGHDFFIREGLNLRYKKMISFEESICGFTFNLEYLNGNTICIRNGSGDVILNGSIKTIKNRGMVRNNRMGDLIIEFIIKQPGRIPSDTIQKLKNILFEQL